ncbi:uncharacterized protein LOC144987779 isoform X3 [Oryzias latipes]
MSSEPQEGSVREQLSAAEGTIVQNEEELCRQRRLLDSSWNPQLQLHHIVLPQHWMTEEEDLSNQQRNFRVEQEEPEPPQIKEEQEEPEPPQIKEEAEPPQIKEEQEEAEPPQIKEEAEPPQIKEEPGEHCICQDEDQIDLKQETDTLMEIPTYEEDENIEADLNNQQSFNVTDSQDEEGNQHEESTSTSDEETDPQNRDHLHTIVLPQCWMTKEEDLCIQQRNFRVEQEEPEPQQIKEEQEEQEPPQIQEEPGELCISQDEEQLDLKQETDTLMEIPTYEEDENSEADLNNQQSFNVTDSQDEEGNQHEESTSTTDEETESTPTSDEETDPQNRDQRNRRDRSHVQSVDSSHISESQCDSDVRKNPKKTNLGKKYKKSQKEKRLSSIKSGKNSRIITNPSDYMETGSDKRCYICKECGKSFGNKSLFKIRKNPCKR